MDLKAKTSQRLQRDLTEDVSIIDKSRARVKHSEQARRAAKIENLVTQCTSSRMGIHNSNPV